MWLMAHITDQLAKGNEIHSLMQGMIEVQLNMLVG